MKSQLKFITCGSVDDGKSTLIGRLLYDAKLLFADQASALELDSRIGSAGGNMDYSLLLDGLMAEREQGITIDVAFRYFTTRRRSFIVADCPGHEQYTRNMAVGASFANLAVILVDASHGVVTQTRRHARICALMGIRHFVLAVNKMDLVQFDASVFDSITQSFRRYMVEFQFDSMQIIPVSATGGDNVVEKSLHMPWYVGPALLDYLESVDADVFSAEKGFILPVQRVVRPNHSFRGFAGQIEAGSIAPGDVVTSLPGGESAGVKEILVCDAQANTALTGQPVTLRLDREIDVSRGSVLVKDAHLDVNDQLSANILWMDSNPLIAGRGYLLKCATCMLPAHILAIKSKVDVDTGSTEPASRLLKNEIAKCDVSLSQPMVFAPFRQNKALGGFILIDRVSHATAGVGVIRHSLRRSTNIHWQKTDITREQKAQKLGQTPKTLWFTGLSGSGKSTLANALERKLTHMGYHTSLLDGDNVRHGLCRDLGFSEADRVENIRRVAHVAKLMNDAGLIVLASFISPYRQDRQRAREIIGEKSYVEIYVNTPLQECERRDTKGLYSKARMGEIPNFTGISSPYEAPLKADITVDTTRKTIEKCVEELLNALNLK